MRILSIPLSAIFVLSLAFLTAGCGKKSNPVSTDEVTFTSDDAADAISDALAVNNGGAIDEAGNVVEIAAGVGAGGQTDLGKASSENGIAVYDSVSKTYNPSDTSWTIYVARERGDIGTSYYAQWSRTLRVQFLNGNGIPQPLRVTNGIAAAGISFNIISQRGYFKTPRLIHHLNSVTGEWLATGTNSDTVTINGTYVRSGTDTLKVRGSRIVDYTLSLTFVNVKGPRGTRLNFAAKSSGTISGTFTATVTANGKTRTITKTFTITLGGGKATIAVDGQAYTGDLTTGDRT